MRVLVTGAHGFIGRQVVAALAAAGHEVISARRGVGRAPPLSGTEIDCDFARDQHAAVWRERLRGIDAVVNCAGILRERGRDTFEHVHVSGPLALFRGCVEAGVGRVIQVSALGDPTDGEFIASKHRGDSLLMSLPLRWTVLRPSIVYATRGSYGGTSLLRAMAALPGVLPLPIDGQQRIAPVCAADLAKLVVDAVGSDAGAGEVIEVTGPEIITFETYLRAWRYWLGFADARSIRVPRPLVALASRIGEAFGSGPLGLTMLRMLERGNVPTEATRPRAGGARATRRLADVLAAEPGFVQDRWHARLYFLSPVLRVALATVWIASGVVGFVTPMTDAQRVLDAAGLPGGTALVYGASSIDLLLGVLLLLRRCVGVVGALMLLSLLAYTLLIGTSSPGAWLDPFGGLLKNVALLPAVAVMMVLEQRR